MTSVRKVEPPFRIAVVGGAQASKAECELSQEFGRQLAGLGTLVGCGGGGGVMKDVTQVAIAAFQESIDLDNQVPTFADHQQMLAEVKPDAVVISTPHTLHFSQIMDSLEAGCHVHTEKPMVCTVEHAKQVIAKVEETGKHLMIGYQRHLQPAYMYCRQVVQSGELGKANFVTARQRQNWYRGTHGPWRINTARSGRRHRKEIRNPQ